MAKRVQSETEQTLRFVAKLALFVLILRSFIVAPFSIPSESMLPRLYIGDYLLVAKWPFGYSRWSLPFGVPLLPDLHWATPRRGDVVVFRSPDPASGDTDPAHAPHDVIKRVIGLPGDTIQVRNGQLILNGQAVPRDRIADFVLPLSPNFANCPIGHQQGPPGGAVCRYTRYRETLPGGRSYTVLDTADFPDRDNTGLYSVPAGVVFLMGDNRDDSADSRWAAPQGMGYIPMNRIEGRALVSVFSTDGSASWIRPWTWFTAARPERIGEGF
ncbi:signal peptidase I [Sphingomonas sp.]|uniref:signal peptidase I n=1 Tax=Sphingomonas sp. TaxID=28214 RepID=UPI003CC6C694